MDTGYCVFILGDTVRKIIIKPVKATAKTIAMLNNVVTIEDIMSMYGMSKSATWKRVKLYCVYIQRRQPYGVILVDLSSVIRVFGFPPKALPIVKAGGQNERTSQ